MIALLLLLQVERGSTEPLPFHGDAAQAMPADAFEWELTFSRERDHCTEYALTFPSPVDSGSEQNDLVRAKYWRPRGRGPFPAFVVLHWLAGNFGPLETFCLRLAEHDVAALMVWMPHYGDRRVDGKRMLSTDLDETIAGCTQASMDARRAGHWLHARAEVDPGRVGILGISLGSFIASATAGVDNQFNLVVPVIGGGDIAAVLMHDSREVRRVRDELVERGYTVESLRKELAPIDPTTFASSVPRERVLMINMEDDEIVPRASTDALYEAFGRPEIRWYPGGHYAVAMRFGDIVWEVVKFARPERWY